MGDDGFKKVHAKRRKQCRVPIACGLCGKTCPAFVIDAGAKPGCTPAECRAAGCGAKLSVKKAKAAIAADAASAAAADAAPKRNAGADPGSKAQKELAAAKALGADMVKKLAAQTKAHDQEVKKLKAKLEAKPSADDEEMAVDESSDDPSELDAAIEDAKDEVAAVKATPERLRSRLEGGYESQLARAGAQLNAALDAKREAGSLEKQLAQTEGWRDRKQNAADKARAAIVEAQADMEAKARTIVEMQTELLALDNAAAEAHAKFKDLAARFAQEKVGSPTPAGSAGAASAPSNESNAVQEAVDKAVAAARTSWELAAAARWEQGEAALRVVLYAEKDKMLTEALAQYQKELDEADAEDDASVVDASELEPLAKRQKENEKKARVAASRKESRRKFTEEVHKANLKIKK